MEKLLASRKNVENVFADYSRMSDQYYENMVEVYHRGEYRKASELLWGAISQLIKALAALYGKRITAHSDFFPFVKQISKEIKNPDYYELFLFVHNLHKNFYDQMFPNEDFIIYLQNADHFIIKTREYIEKRLKELGIREPD
ncbi:MAG: PaREP1 family protein [Kosmotogaceae bacterium]